MADQIINYTGTVVPYPDAVWRDALSGQFSVHGLYEPLALGKYQRLPDALLKSEQINQSARKKALHTSGGRIRFVTDSPYVAVAAELPRIEAFPHISVMGTSGIDLYEAPFGSSDSRFRVCIFPGMSRRWNVTLPVAGIPTDFTSPVTVEGGYEFPDRKGQLREITLYLPLYNSVSRILIGLAPDAKILPPRPYTHPTPVVVYGSSISQGASASRPGMSYMAILSRMLDCDFIDLGFSGSELGDLPVAEYIASLSVSAFLDEQGANSPTAEFLQQTHEPFYKTVRAGIGSVPTVFLSTPTNPYQFAVSRLTADKREIVRATAEAAAARGENVQFVDGASIFGADWENAAADGIHPNDVGAFRIAEKLAPLLRKALSE